VSAIPKVHKAPREGWSFTECGMRRAAFDASGDWDDVTCKLCLRTKRRRERFEANQRARETDGAKR
jgi:hypothetical protein